MTVPVRDAGMQGFSRRSLPENAQAPPGGEPADEVLIFVGFDRVEGAV